MKAERGDEALRRFRISSPGADYFLTPNLADKSGPTLAPATKQAIRTEIKAIEASGHWYVRGAVIMPDRLHLLVSLGSSLPLSRAVARLKSKTRAPWLHRAPAGRTTTTNTVFAHTMISAGCSGICS